MKTYFNTKIKYKLEDDQGKLKTITEEYLVDAVNFTEAEARITQHLSGSMGEFTVEKVTKTKIIDVLNYSE
jgi:hypothetical protein